MTITDEIDGNASTQEVATVDPYMNYSDRELLILLHKRMDNIEALVNQATASVLPMLQQLEQSPMGRMFGGMLGRR